jgi:hypothetical protein
LPVTERSLNDDGRLIASCPTFVCSFACQLVERCVADFNDDSSHPVITSDVRMLDATVT